MSSEYGTYYYSTSCITCKIKRDKLIQGIDLSCLAVLYGKNMVSVPQ